MNYASLALSENLLSHTVGDTDYEFNEKTLTKSPSTNSKKSSKKNPSETDEGFLSNQVLNDEEF
jgi:hypothetical protein